MLARRIKNGPEKDRLLSILLEDSDLPDGHWTTGLELAYRTDLHTRRTDEVRRAQESGSVTVARTLKSDRNDLSVALRVTPFASAVDAAAYLPTFIDYLYLLVSKAHTTEDHREVEEVPGLPDAWLDEVQLVRRPFDGPKVVRKARIVVGVIDWRILVIQCDSSPAGELLPWPDVAAIAGLQAAKVRRYQSET